MFIQLHNTLLWYYNVFDALYMTTLMNEAIQKYLIYL